MSERPGQARRETQPGVAAVLQNGFADVAELPHHVLVLDVLVLHALAMRHLDDVLHQVLGAHHIILIVG